MFKKLLLLFLLLFGIIYQTNAISIPIEKVFKDIDKNYKYYNELQTLYDKGMIFPDENNNFNPHKLLTRAEFVGIASEVTCKKCIKPNTDVYFIDKYTAKPFFDVGQNNKYFYCIADAKQNLYVKGYDIGVVCNDGIHDINQKPFCVNNTITLEEALAVLFRMSGILTNIEAEKIVNEIISGKSYPNIADDVKPFIDDNNHIYSFYPYFKKASDYELVGYDNDGKQIIYKFLKFDGNKLRPNQPISKEKFLTMAFIALKSSSCIDSSNVDNLAVSINILDKTCSENRINCDSSDLKDDTNIYDYKAIVGGQCDLGISEAGYIWNFYNLDSQEELIVRGKYLDNFDFLKQCKSEKCNNFKVKLSVIDNCKNTGKASFVFSFDNDLGDGDGDGNGDIKDKNTGFGLTVNAGPLSGVGPLDVDFDVIIDGGIDPYTCRWDFGDGTFGEGMKPKHKFIDNGIYTIITTCKDNLGNESNVTTIVRVTDKNNKVYTDDQLGLVGEATPIYGEGPLDVDFEATLEGGVGPYKCIWDFGDGTKGEGIKPNHVYYESGLYKVITICNDINGLKSEVITAVIKVVDKKEKHCLSAFIKTNKISGPGPLNIDLDGVADGCNPGFTYSWDLGDGTNGYGKNIKHIFKDKGTYNIILTVVDDLGDTIKSEITINVTENIDCSIDSDKDGINDCEDKCSLVFGENKNFGCPIFEKSCSDGCSCPEGYTCSDPSEKSCKTDGICLPKETNLGGCLTHDGKSGYNEANTVCETCPCPVSIDFVSKIRACDGIFPAITSPDSSKIYTRGGVFQIK